MTSMPQETKRIIIESLREKGVESSDQDFILNLFDSIIATLNMDATLTVKDMASVRHEITSNIIDSSHLLTMLRQQTAELDALRRLSLHLSSSLDLVTVLRAVVRDARDVLENSRTIHIFLYNHEEDLLEFGAALDESGLKNKSFAEPRQNGLTYQVARSAEIITVPDIKKDPKRCPNRMGRVYHRNATQI